MSSGMYDRLGDLLNQTLENGKIPEPEEENKETPEVSEEKESDHKTSSSSSSSDSAKDSKRKSAASSSSAGKPSGPASSGFKTVSPADMYSVFHAKDSLLVPDSILSDFRLLQIDFTQDQSIVKKAYRERLQYFHPDKYNDNPVLQKIASGKTAQIVDAYNRIIEWLNNNIAK